jgi:hypothetical protein
MLAFAFLKYYYIDMSNPEAGPSFELLRPWEAVTLDTMRELGVIACFDETSQFDDFEVKIAAEMEQAILGTLGQAEQARMKLLSIGKLATNKEIKKIGAVQHRFEITPVSDPYTLVDLQAQLAGVQTLVGLAPQKRQKIKDNYGAQDEDLVLGASFILSAGLHEKHLDLLTGYCGLKLRLATNFAQHAPTVYRYHIDTLMLAEHRNDLYPARLQGQ